MAPSLPALRCRPTASRVSEACFHALEAPLPVHWSRCAFRAFTRPLQRGTFDGDAGMSDSLASTADANFWLDAVPLHLPPETLKQRLAGLIRDAVRQGSASVAETVVRHFQALSLHPALASERDERAAYCRGARHWRQIAWARCQPSTQPLDRPSSRPEFHSAAGAASHGLTGSGCQPAVTGGDHGSI